MCPIVWIMNIPHIVSLISVVGIMLGFFVFFKPELTIEIQRKFYEKLNWRIEPISMKREIRNTKIMGMTLVVVSVIAIISSYSKLIIK